MLKTTVFGVFLGLLPCVSALAGPGVLISGFDPFDQASENNSHKIGKRVVEGLRQAKPEVEFKYCQLRTVYDKSAQELLDCAASMKEPPRFILSLGETGCGEVKIETAARNYDYDFSGDNDGVHREGSPIIPGAPERLGLNLPLQKAWCGLSRKEQSFASPSRDAGSFVCNNLSYHMALKNPDVLFGFIHVPAHDCFWWPGRNIRKSVAVIEKLVLNMLEHDPAEPEVHPVGKKRVKAKAQTSQACERDFYQRLLKRY